MSAGAMRDAMVGRIEARRAGAGVGGQGEVTRRRVPGCSTSERGVPVARDSIFASRR